MSVPVPAAATPADTAAAKKKIPVPVPAAAAPADTAAAKRKAPSPAPAPVDTLHPAKRGGTG
jgi:hypothetical protein